LCALANYGESFARSPEEAALIQAGLGEAATVEDRLPPLGKVYFHILSLLNGGDQKKHFEKLQGLFAAFAHRIPASEQRNIFGLMINYLHANDQKGKAGSLDRQFIAYKEMLRLGLVFGQGAFSVNSARNISIVGTRLGEFAWTRSFLETIPEMVPGPAGLNVLHYGSAYLSLAEGRCSDARRHLSQVDYSDPFYKMANDILMLRIAFEEKSIDLFHHQHAALSRHLYRREDISEGFRQGLHNLLKVMMALMDLGSRRCTAEDIAQLRQMLADFKLVFNREWLEDKIAELEVR
jgi:hypothetical protein